jgi:hypothetical protein
MVFDVTRNLFVRGEPHPRAGAYVLHQLIEDAHAGAVSNDMRMHGEQK